MNENIDLTKILKNCPRGYKLYSPLFGEVIFEGFSDIKIFPIATTNSRNIPCLFTKEGFYNDVYTDVECLLFPSKDQRDWSKFTAPWLKKERFNPKTFAPFDKVLVRDTHSKPWRCSLFSHIETDRHLFPYATSGGNYSFCIPYNEETKSLVGTYEDAPEFYRYWED